jgi:hypothetical protein
MRFLNFLVFREMKLLVMLVQLILELRLCVILNVLVVLTMRMNCL